jgi:serpin B
MAVAIGLALALPLASCGRTEPQAPQLSTQERTKLAQQLDERVAAATNGFGLELTQRLADARPGANTVVSPASVMQALTMTWNGAAGPTRQAMTATLRLEGLSTDDVNRS